MLKGKRGGCAGEKEKERASDAPRWAQFNLLSS